MSASGSSINLMGKQSSAGPGLLRLSESDPNIGPVSAVLAGAGRMAAVATGRGQAAAADGIIACDGVLVGNLPGLPAGATAWEPAAVVEGEREWEKLLADGVPAAVMEGENLMAKAVPGPTVSRIGSEKGKTVAPVQVIGPPPIESATMRKRKVAECLQLGESSRRLAHEDEVAIRKMKKVVEEVPKKGGNNIMTVSRLVDIMMVRRNRGDPFSQIIQEADVYSKPPEELVQEFAGWRTLWMDKLGKTNVVSLFMDIYGAKGRRSRMVGGSSRQEGVAGKWHADHKAVPLEDFPCVSKTQYYYRINCSTSKKRGEWTGWCMTQFSLEENNQEEGTYMVCKVYQSNRSSHQELPTAAPLDSSTSGGETPTNKQGQDEAEAEDGGSVDASLGSPRATGTGLAYMNKLLIRAAEKAIGCRYFKKACKINEFVIVKELLLRIIDKLGLDRFIISELLDKLKIRLQHVAMDKELPPKERDVIVSYGEHMWKTIYSAHFDECVRQVQADFLPKLEGGENERPSEEAEGGNRLGIEEEVTDTLQDEWRNHPGGLPDLPRGNMPCPTPGFASYESGLHVEREWQAAEGWSPGGLLNNMSMGEDISSPAPAFPLCMSGLHPAAICQNTYCDLESVAFDAWASSQ